MNELWQIASSKGGSIIDGDSRLASSRLTISCEHGHQWKSSAATLKMGFWCRQCLGSDRYSVQQLTRHAKLRGGICHAVGKAKSKEKIKWECDKGHIFLARVEHVYSGSWCPECAPNKRIEMVGYQSIAARHGGSVVSTQIEHSMVKAKFLCKEGHVFETQAKNVLDGYWCRKCGGTAPLDINEMREIAAARGGRCISVVYKNNRELMTWECSEGHRWRASADNVKARSWCPTCSSGLGERMVRHVFETIFKTSFPKVRPTWLLQENGYALELDGYSEELKLAFEHAGQQHDRFIPYFHDTLEVLSSIQNRDRIKRELCEQRGVKILIIPEVPTIISKGDLKSYIIELCHQDDVPLSVHATAVEIDWSKLPKSRFEEGINTYQKIALGHGGRCISESYLGQTSKLSFECRMGHRFESHPTNVKNGKWCSKCRGGVRLSLQAVKARAEPYGGRLLSDAVKNVKEKLRWQCSEGHEFERSAEAVKYGSWCPDCKSRCLSTP